MQYMLQRLSTGLFQCNVFALLITGIYVVELAGYQGFRPWIKIKLSMQVHVYISSIIEDVLGESAGEASIQDTLILQSADGSRSEGVINPIMLIIWVDFI